MTEVNEYFLPATQTYSEIEPAFQACTTGDYIIPVAWGARSRVLGRCQEYRLGSGQCLGAFHSRDVDTSDTPWECITQENKATNVCKVNGSPIPHAQTSKAPQLERFSANTTPGTNTAPKSLKDFSHTQNTGQAHSAANLTSASIFNANSGYKDPYMNGSNPYMSFSVFDKPYVSRGKQSSSDPAGYLMGVSTYVGLQKRAEQSTAIPNETWGPCSSYGTYSGAPNASLSANSCIGNNCLCGNYTMPSCSASQ
jgi:hypothetical protein